MSTTERRKKEELTQDSQQKTGNTSPVYNAGGGYVESDAVRQAKENLNSLQKPGAYQSQWQQSLNDIIGKIQNREKFTYDLNGDALYQQYKNQYMTQGQQAMMDTMGQAAALTGGYGNSYAQSVGQQTYQGYLQQLNDKVPELYQLALDQYNREGEDLYNQYSLYADRDETEYGRYRDTVSDYNTERDYLTGRLDSEKSFDYGQYRDTVADDQWQTEFDEGKRQFDTTFDYQKERDNIADNQWQAEFDENKRQFDTNTSLTREQMKIQQEQWQAEYDESVRQFNKDYELTVKQINEDIRHNKITESQGQQQINLAKEELAQQKEEANKDYIYKMASLGLKTDGSKISTSKGSKSSGNSGSSQASSSNTTKPSYNSIVSDLNTYIANGAKKSEINNYLREAYKSGYITQSQYNSLKGQFTPRGYTY